MVDSQRKAGSRQTEHHNSAFGVAAERGGRVANQPADTGQPSLSRHSQADSRAAQPHRLPDTDSSKNNTAKTKDRSKVETLADKSQSTSTGLAEKNPSNSKSPADNVDVGSDARVDLKDSNENKGSNPTAASKATKNDGGEVRSGGSSFNIFHASDGVIVVPGSGLWAYSILGTNGPDLVFASDGNDYISGGAGDDVLYGLFGDDFILGGDGDDWLFGVDGYNRLSGDKGNDTIYERLALRRRRGR